MHIDLVLSDANQKEFEKKLKEELEKGVKHFERDLLSVRTGRAHTSLVDGVRVSAYGNTLLLKEVAHISAPESRVILISPWDVSIISDIEKALIQSDLGITPANDGKLIRIVLPEMSTQRREELAKVLAKKTEEARVSARNVRKEFNNLIRESFKNKHISEDHSRRLNDVLQKHTDETIKRCEDLAEKKKIEITEV